MSLDRTAGPSRVRRGRRFTRGAGPIAKAGTCGLSLRKSRQNAARTDGACFNGTSESELAGAAVVLGPLGVLASQAPRIDPLLTGHAHA